MAREDETQVFINGELKHTFDFASNPKRTFEFEIGENDVYCSDKNHKGNLPYPMVADSSCFITTSCPAATHLFMVSNTYDNKINGVESTGKGDPAMVWVNPIEQRINDITFATYGSSNTHYVNVVTDSSGVASMKLDGNDISADFRPVSGSNDKWYFARKAITYDTHRLTGDTGFIAHVYGYGDKESYGYSAGGATKPLTQYITINGEIFTPDSKNTLCGEDTVRYACHPDYKYDSIYWYFGDGEYRMLTYAEAQIDTVIPHYYADSKTYDAYVLIYRESSNICKGQNAVDSIPIAVTIGRYQFTVKPAEIPCPEDGKEYIGRIPYSNPGNVNLHGDNVKIEFDSVAKADHFDDAKLVIFDDHFQISIPDSASADKTYGIHLVITSDCGGADTTLTFGINFDNDILTQRYGYLLGLNNSMSKYQLSDFQWYRLADSTAVEGQVTANLNFYELENGYAKPGDAFFVCFTRDKGTANETKQCSCAKAFDADSNKPNFGTPDEVIITASYAWLGDKIFVNADWKGKTDIECFAQWITVSGDVYQDLKFNIPDGGCTISVPQENGFYILRVTTDGSKRSFKFIINH
jgi:hypothetical protein